MILLHKYFLIVSVYFVFISCQAQNTVTKNESKSSVAENISTPPIGTFTIDYLTGKFDPSKHPDFMEIPAMYRDAEVRYLRRDVMKAFTAMYEAARNDGVKLTIISATRNFANQKRIWENKWTGKTLLENSINAATDISSDVARALKIMEYSSMPGTSRHHWGTDIDLNNLNNSWFEQNEGLALYNWMQKNASAFGFCQPYTKLNTDRASGFSEEKWHWTYVPVSGILTKLAKDKLTNEMISGFEGSETAVKIDVHKKYVLSISPSCTTSPQ